MEAGPVRFAVEDGQAFLTIDRPDARNALSAEVVDGLAGALRRAEADPAARVVILTGAGNRVFSAGGDLSGLGPEGFLAGHDGRRRYGLLLEAIAACPKPTLARVNGHALGGGLGLVCACDLAVSADHAELGTPEVDVGLFPMMVLAWLQRHLGRKRALEMVLTGLRLRAADALAWGLVNRVVPAAELDRATRELGAVLSGKSQAVLALGKRAFRRAEGLPVEAATELLAAELSLNLTAEDAAEGVAAFLAKRPPAWKDR
ncbi:MAG TPA: enoyl-CoA hydratase-related protein [Myxococcaceae bacterium]|jgi:enoyl-CoA hydratase/carnithine racemase|nr:enoyl-CoA hydratase-related protein [Myxococcaceae bacterium]